MDIGIDRNEDTIRSVGDGDEKPLFMFKEEREEWEEEQKKLEREWYQNDQGYDDEYNNPFADVSQVNLGFSHFSPRFVVFHSSSFKFDIDYHLQNIFAFVKKSLILFPFLK